MAMMTFRRVLTAGLLAALVLAASPHPAAAQEGPPEPPDVPPFSLPLAGDPSPDTWVVTQWYGNTQFSYHYRHRYYEAGQGLHFGLDFGAPCGTEIHAIGDGVVTRIDDERHGSGPHNLMIVHPNGFASFYGHLLEAAPLYIGQEVKQGDVIARTGDPDLTCESRPHLHLEIRNDQYNYAYNPVAFIDADWDTLSLFGPIGGFQRDLENPRRWLTPQDQPTVDFWGGALNDYQNPWPPDWAR